MTKKESFCDICGAEIDEPKKFVAIGFGYVKLSKLDLCHRCMDGLLDYIQDRQKEHSLISE